MPGNWLWNARRNFKSITGITHHNENVSQLSGELRMPIVDRSAWEEENHSIDPFQTECKAAEAKLRTAETQRMKLQQTIPKEKLERSKKYRLIEKEMLKVSCVNGQHFVSVSIGNSLSRTIHSAKTSTPMQDWKP